MAVLQEPLTLAQMELIERTQRLPLEHYARMMLTMLQEQSPMDVKDLWKRAPDEFKGNTLLTSLNGVADSLTEQSFTKLHAQWKNIAFPPALNDLAVDVSKRLQFFGLEHVRRVYTVISLDRFATVTGYQDDHQGAIAFALESGCGYDPTTGFFSITPLMPDESAEDGDWTADLEGLGMIGDSIWALSRQPNPTNDSMIRKMHDY